MEFFRQVQHVGSEPFGSDEKHRWDERKKQEFPAVSHRPNSAQRKQKQTVQSKERKPSHEMRRVMKEPEIDDGKKGGQGNQNKPIRPQPTNAKLNDDHADECDCEKC